MYHCPAPSMLCTWISTAAGGIVVLCVSLKIFPISGQTLSIFWGGRGQRQQQKSGKKIWILLIIGLFRQTVEKSPRKPFLMLYEVVYTYQDVERRSNRVASEKRWHCGPADGPDFIPVWFGLAKLAFIVAFLSINIHSRSLLQCINTCAAQALVIGEGKFCVVFHCSLSTVSCFYQA